MPGAGKKGAKAAAKVTAARNIKDLDLALPVTDDVEIVHNKKQRKQAYAAAGVDDDDDDDHIAVLPGEAHDDSDDEYENFDDMREAARMATAASRQHRKGLADDDFGVSGLPEPEEDMAAGPSTSTRGSGKAKAAAATLEEVDRDFAKLTTAQRLAMLKKESPEVLSLLHELRSHIESAHASSDALKKARIQAKAGSREHELVDFLETKAALMLTYCAHISMYLLLKAEGTQINGHPVVDRLVEIRTYIEKLNPVEQRLSYSLNKMLSGQAASAPNVSRLRPVSEHSGELFQVNKTRAVDDDKAARRRAQARLDKQQELDLAEEAEMTRTRGKAIMKDGDLELLQAADPGTEERTDHFLSGMVEYDSDDDEDAFDDDDGDAPRGGGKSLMDKLRAKVSSAAKDKLRGKPSQPKKKRQQPTDEDDVEDADDFDGEEGDGEVDYDALLAEEYARDEDEANANADRPSFKEREADRRQVTQKILSHRGLTKSRPKDKKNPRVAKREKYSKGSKGAAAQGRGARAERPDNFVGVPKIKTNVTHSTRLS